MTYLPKNFKIPSLILDSVKMLVIYSVCIFKGEGACGRDWWGHVGGVLVRGPHPPLGPSDTCWSETHTHCVLLLLLQVCKYYFSQKYQCLGDNGVSHRYDNRIMMVMSSYWLVRPVGNGRNFLLTLPVMVEVNKKVLEFSVILELNICWLKYEYYWVH